MLTTKEINQQQNNITQKTIHKLQVTQRWMERAVLAKNKRDRKIYEWIRL